MSADGVHPAPEYGAYGGPNAARQQTPETSRCRRNTAESVRCLLGGYGDNANNVNANAQQPVGSPVNGEDRTRRRPVRRPRRSRHKAHKIESFAGSWCHAQGPNGRPAARKTANNVVVAVVAALVAAVLCLDSGMRHHQRLGESPDHQLTSGVSSNTSGSGSTNSKTTSTDWTTVEKKVSESVVSIQRPSAVE